MTVNPALLDHSRGDLIPHLYPEETLVLSRASIDVDVDGVASLTRWQTRGCLFLTNLRLVFVAEKDIEGLKAFDFPLAYIRNAKFNQPIFFCNNLAGEVWSTAEGGGPQGDLPPHKFALYFKNGGVGTFIPLFFRLAEAMQEAFSSHRPSQLQDNIKDTVATAFVDPSDPSKIILTQPAQENRIPTAPVYAPNYGREEAYEDMHASARQ